MQDDGEPSRAYKKKSAKNDVNKDRFLIDGFT